MGASAKRQKTSRILARQSRNARALGSGLSFTTKVVRPGPREFLICIEVKAAGEGPLCTASKADGFDRFLEDCVAADPRHVVQSTTLYDAYCAWAEAKGNPIRSHKAMTTALKQGGLLTYKYGCMYWIGVKLILDCDPNQKDT
jgi:hypothetical protein